MVLIQWNLKISFFMTIVLVVTDPADKGHKESPQWKPKNQLCYSTWCPVTSIITVSHGLWGWTVIPTAIFKMAPVIRSSFPIRTPVSALFSIYGVILVRAIIPCCARSFRLAAPLTTPVVTFWTTSTRSKTHHTTNSGCPGGGSWFFCICHRYT